MQCYICSEEIGEANLCKKHANQLHEQLEKKENHICNPDWRYHCRICGEHENRIIIEFRPYGYFCDIDIIEEWKRYN